MSEKKVATTVYLEQRQLDALKHLKEVTKVPMAELIRQGIDKVLTREELRAMRYDIYVDRTGLSPGHELELECGPPTPFPTPEMKHDSQGTDRAPQGPGPGPASGDGEG